MRLIDADALKKVMIETLEALLKNPKMDNQEAHLLAAFHTVGNMIEDAQTVSPDMAQVLAYECGKAERKCGRWVDGHCSECGCDVPAYIIDWKWQKDMDAKFCPMCGADMRVEANDAICSK